MFDNMKITLLPSQKMEPKPLKGDGKTLLAKKEFVKEVLSSKVMFVLLGKESSKGEELHELVKRLLEDLAKDLP